MAVMVAVCRIAAVASAVKVYVTDKVAITVCVALKATEVEVCCACAVAVCCICAVAVRCACVVRFKVGVKVYVRVIVGVEVGI